MSQLRRMFENITEAYTGSGRKMDFVWHGGEPLLIEPAYYDEIFNLQQKTLGAAGIDFSNSIQTNLTLLSDSIVSLLKRRFTHVGVSLDLFGTERVTANGRHLESRVVSNIQSLREAGVKVGCITVLSRATVKHVSEIYRFYETCGLSFRLLPIYRTSYLGQQDLHALTAAEIRTAFIEAADLWFASDSEIQVRPIQDYVINAVRFLHIEAVDLHLYNRREAEVVYIVDTDGSLYSNGDAYDSRLSHGNVFEQGFGEMRASTGYGLSIEGCDGRMEATCGACRLHGACSGYFMGDSTPEQRYQENGKLICSVAQPLQEYVLARLRDPVLYEALTARGALSSSGPDQATSEI